MTWGLDHRGTGKQGWGWAGARGEGGKGEGGRGERDLYKKKKKVTGKIEETKLGSLLKLG